jgi:hypothetical protein
MKIVAAVFLSVTLAGVVSAQHRNFGSASGFGNIRFPGTGRAPFNPSNAGFGNVVFPGSGRVPGTPRTPPQFGFPVGVITNPGFAKGLAGTVNGRIPFGSTVGRRGGFGGGVGQGFGYVPYPYPVYMGGGPEGYVWQDQGAAPMYQQQQPPQPVVINQTFVGGAQSAPAEAEQGQGETAGVQVYEAPTRTPEEMAAAAPPPASYYLIALKDHSIYSAIAYWIDGENLHYFTQGNVHNQV